MPEDVRLWRIEGSHLKAVSRSQLDLESRLEAWLKEDISILDPELLVIGRQVETDFGGIIDLLCIDRTGDLVVVELKRHRTAREITAQALDYGSWVKDLTADQIVAIAEGSIGQGEFDEAFKRKFDAELPETLNENHRLLIVAAQIDASSERIIKYLSDTYGVSINAATFHYFKEESGSELLARVFLIEPAQVEQQNRRKGSSKRRANLTYEELEAIAAQNGVAELYRDAVGLLEKYLQKTTTRSSIAFTGKLDGRRTVLSLIPGESDATTGLRFQVYFRRLIAFLGVTEDEGLAMLPEHREPYSYWDTAGDDYTGFEGFFANRTELDRFLDGIKKARENKPGAGAVTVLG